VDAAFVITLLVLLITLGTFVRLRLGMRKLQRLADIPPAPAGAAPRVSIVFSALNEAATIEPALRSLLALDYPNLEIIAIDDRSTDATGAILDRLGREHSVLRVLHIRELPPGWLGKNHALQRGGEVASGDYLLFTDADVVFDRNALSRAVAHCERGKLDHLVVLAEFIVREHLLAMLMISGSAAMFAKLQPWKVRTSARHFFGMGAFNMVRAAAYRQAGGHTPLALEVIDDILLGKLMKQKGFSQDVLLGYGSVSVEWYRNAREMVRGLEKNSFAMFDYRLWKLALASAVLLPLRYWPWIGLFVTQGATWWMNLAALAIGLATLEALRRPTGWSRRCFAYWPLIGVVSLLAVWRAVVLALWRNGIDWRGTRYPLAELKRHHY
jgi:glycosyltransferase involved in cell wall biosynthesis